MFAIFAFNLGYNLGALDYPTVQAALNAAKIYGYEVVIHQLDENFCPVKSVAEFSPVTGQKIYNELSH
jgi:hypothetical protein